MRSLSALSLYCVSFSSSFSISTSHRTWTPKSNSHGVYSRADSTASTGSDSSTESRDKSSHVRVSTLNLVDLAGSERTSEAGTVAGGSRFKEGVNINKSLLTLGVVIEKLAQKAADASSGSSSSSKNGIYVPFRNSKLTRILEPSLGGNARTAVICTISPLVRHREQSMGTLRFARRAVCVQQRAVVNKVSMEAAMIGKHTQKISELKSRLQEFKPNEDGTCGLKAGEGVAAGTSGEGGALSGVGGVTAAAAAAASTAEDRVRLTEANAALATERQAVEAQRVALEVQLKRLTSLVLNARTVPEDRAGVYSRLGGGKARANHLPGADALGLGKGGANSGELAELIEEKWGMTMRRETWCPGFWGKALAPADYEDDGSGGADSSASSAHPPPMSLRVSQSSDDGRSTGDSSGGDGGAASEEHPNGSGGGDAYYRGIQVEKLRTQNRTLKEALAERDAQCVAYEATIGELEQRCDRAEGASTEAFVGLQEDELDMLESFHLSALARIAEARLLQTWRQRYIEREAELEQKLEEARATAAAAEEALAAERDRRAAAEMARATAEAELSTKTKTFTAELSAQVCLSPSPPPPPPRPPPPPPPPRPSLPGILCTHLSLWIAHHPTPRMSTRRGRAACRWRSISDRCSTARPRS